MDKNKKIIIALLVIIVALIVVLALIMPNVIKEDTNLKFKSNSTLTEGSSLKVQLTDANGSAIANQTVNITITDKDKSNSYYSVVTNEKGVGTLKLYKDAGEYNVTVSYDGNDKYNGCNASKKLTIKEKVSQSRTSNTIEGPEYDDLGISKQQAMEAMRTTGWDVKYDPESGLYVQYDPKYGIYHT